MVSVIFENQLNLSRLTLIIVSLINVLADITLTNREISQYFIYVYL